MAHRPPTASPAAAAAAGAAAAASAVRRRPARCAATTAAAKSHNGGRRAGRDDGHAVLSLSLRCARRLRRMGWGGKWVGRMLQQVFALFRQIFAKLHPDDVAATAKA